MLQYSQHLIESDGPVGPKDYAAGQVEHLDAMMDLPFVKELGGILMVRFHQTDRTMANLLVFKDQKPSILAVLKGDIRPTANIPEYIAMPVVNVKPYEPPATGWGTPAPLDDLLNSGVVKKG